MKTIGGAVALTLNPMPDGAVVLQNGAEPIRLSRGTQLFVDDFMIAAEQKLTREVCHPTRHPTPVITSADDKCFQSYVSVVRDPKTKRFRAWYNTAVSASQSHIGHLESEDGLNWIRPHRELGDPGGLMIEFGASVLDEGPDFADPGRRFKLGWYNNGLFTAFSPDGLKWTPTANERNLGGIGDITSISRDPIRKRYLLICKVNSRPEDGYKGSTPNAAEGTRRMVGQSFSDDCIHWTPAERIIVPDDKDEGVTEFYSIGRVIERGGLLIGTFKVLRDDLPPEPGGEITGLGYTCLAWTRDGKMWHREREPFLDRNPQPGSWDRAMTWGDMPIIVGDEVFIYYGGYASGHKVERFKERQIGLARMKQDRFVARRAGAEGGVLRTPTVSIGGSGITVNADVRGELRASLLDTTGKPIAGFGAAEVEPVRGDSLAHGLKWKSPLNDLNGAAVQIEFRMHDASLFGFDIR